MGGGTSPIKISKVITQCYDNDGGNHNYNGAMEGLDITDYTTLVIGSVTKSSSVSSMWGNVQVSNDLTNWTVLKTYTNAKSTPDTFDISAYKYLGLQISGVITSQYGSVMYRDIEIS